MLLGMLRNRAHIHDQVLFPMYGSSDITRVRRAPERYHGYSQVPALADYVMLCYDTNWREEGMMHDQNDGEVASVI